MVVLFLGGVRSGKSELAERRAANLGPSVVYVATAIAAGDEVMAARIEAHRRRRPASWTTVEAGADLVAALADLASTHEPVLVDSLGTWLVAQPDLRADVAGLCAALRDRRGPTVLVSEEVGLGVHPPTEIGVRFADALGELNRAVAEIAQEVCLVVAGRALPLAPGS